MFKKILLLITACVMIASSNKSNAVYHHNARNLTPYPVDVHVEYASCNDDKYTVQSNQTSNPIKAGVCAVRNVYAVVKTPQGNIQARKYNGGPLFSGDATFLIVGPLNGNTYEVTRYVH